MANNKRKNDVMKLCNQCFHPWGADDTNCTHCQCDIWATCAVVYSVLQWENWLRSLHNCSHDFMPWNFNEDGTIKPLVGLDGISGSNIQDKHKYSKKRKASIYYRK